MDNKTIKKDNIIYALTLISILTMFLPPIYLPIGTSTLIVYFGELPLYVLFLLSVVAVLKSNKIVINNLFLILFLITFLGLISILNAEDYGRYFIGLSTYIETILIVFIFSNVNFNGNSILKLQKYYLFSSVVLCMQILYETLAVNNGNFKIGEKIVLEIGGSNYLATILMIPFFILLTFVFTKEKQVLNIILLVIIGTSIILTGSRTSLIVLIALTTSIIMKEIFFNFKIKFRKRIKYGLLSIITIVIIYIFTGKFVRQMIEEGRFENLSSQSNAISRFQIYNDYYDAFLSHPIIGSGLMNVDGLNQNYLAHNFILQAFGDGGFLFGVFFILLILYMYLFLNKIIKLKTENAHFVLGYKRGYIAVLIHGLFEPNFGTKLFMIYLFIGYGLIIAEHYNLKKMMKRD